MFKRLNLFIIRSYIGPFVMTFFIALFVLLTQFIWKYVDDMVGKGFEWYVILELLFYASATFVPLALPLAVLLSSLMTFGNLGENYELVAMKASGISLQKVMKPLVFFVLILSICAFFFSNNILPKTTLKFRTLLKDVRQKKPAVSIKEGVFYTEISDYVIKIGKKESDGKGIHNILIYNHTSGSGNRDITFAKDGLMELSADKRFLIFTLFEGYNFNENINMAGNMNRNNMPMQKTYFKKEVRRIDLSAFEFRKSDEEMYKNNYEMLNVSQLMYFKDSLIRERDTTIEEFNRFVLDDFSFIKTYTKLSSKNAVDSIRRLDSILENKKNQELISRFNRMRSEKNEVVVTDTNNSFKLDTTLVLKPDFLANFPPQLQSEIVNAAITNSRNLSYHTDMVTDGLEARNVLIIKHDIEWNKKFALSFACLILFFIGAPLGAIIRKGGLGMPVVISVLLFVTFHIFSIIGEKFAKESILPTSAGIWMASMVFLPVGIFLTLKATSDSPLLDMEVYQKVFKTFSFFKRNKK